MRPLLALACSLLSVALLPAAGPPAASTERPAGIIAFSSLAPRGWDLYLHDRETGRTRRLTDHPELDYNAAFAPDGKHLAFVSQRDGNPELYTLGIDGTRPKRLTRVFALNDHPSFSPDGKRIAFVSTRQTARPGQAWNAVYLMNRDGSKVRRLTPAGVADYSPAWSPAGDRIAVASGSGRAGGTDLFVMGADGARRKLVVKDGGWPTFSADGRALFFHRRTGEQWGIWRINLDGSGLERITPADVEAFTPRASPDGKWLVAAVLHGSHRQIERIDLATRKRTALTNGATDHWNPAISPDGRFVVYHKTTPGLVVPNVELWGTPPGTDLKLLRLAGAFPSFSPEGKRLTLTGGGPARKWGKGKPGSADEADSKRLRAGLFSQLDVMNLDGTERKRLYADEGRLVFSTSWAHHGDRIAFAVGGVFQGPEGEVHLLSVRPDGSDVQKLATTANNGFPAFSPDGKRLVFRSGRDRTAKNLYLMNADGSGVERLTEGKWTDTMCDWSHDGKWITFASDRGGNFEVYLVRPNGSGLRKLIGGGGRNNHPHFSPDGKWIVFTSQRAGYSAEEISLPRQPQPYGDLFAIRIDGSGLVRLTHNGFEEGTPAWGPAVRFTPSAEGAKSDAREY
jgi:Tol biopolymer transport system component